MDIKEILNKKIDMFKIYHYAMIFIWTIYFMFVIFFIAEEYYIHSDFLPNSLILVVLYFIPFSMIYIWKKFIRKRTNIWWYLLQIVMTIITAFYLFIVCVAQHLFYVDFPEKPRIWQYAYTIKKIKHNYDNIYFFPDKLPKNAKKFYMYNYCTPHEGCIEYYLYFKTDKKYINKVIEKNKYSIISIARDENYAYYVKNKYVTNSVTKYNLKPDEYRCFIIVPDTNNEIIFEYSE